MFNLVSLGIIFRSFLSGCLNVIQIVGNVKLLVQIRDGDGGKLLSDPGLESKDVVSPAVGTGFGDLDVLLKLLQYLRVAILVLLDLPNKILLLGLQFDRLGKNLKKTRHDQFV
jgi:hypothetical protein